jgi:hypothetical protein
MNLVVRAAFEVTQEALRHTSHIANWVSTLKEHNHASGDLLHHTKLLNTTAKMNEKIKQVAKEDAEKARAMAAEAFNSQAYLYPFKVCLKSAGIWTSY